MKKLFCLAVTFCLAFAGIFFTSCENETKSSYQFGYEIDPTSGVDEALAMQFLLSEDGSVVIYNEMKKTADQYSDDSRTCIWKSTRSKAINSAKQAFAAGMAAVRKDQASFKGIVIRLYMVDPDTNLPTTIEKATI